MGDNYSVTLEIKFKKSGEKKAIEALKNLIKERTASGRTNFSLDEYAKEGIGTDTFDDLMRVFFAGWRGQEVQIGWRDNHNTTTRTDERGFVRYGNFFSCSYGWQGVMWEMFDTIAPFCEDYTSLLICADEGSIEKEVQSGNVEIVEETHEYEDD